MICRNLFARHLHGDIRLQFAELIQIPGRQLDENSAMQKRLTVLSQFSEQLHHITEVAFSRDRIFEVIGVCKELIFAACVLQNLSLLHAVYQSGVQVNGNCFLVTETGEECLIACLRRVLADRPDRAIAVPADEVIHIEADGRWNRHVEEVFYIGFAVRDFFGKLFFLCHKSSFHKEKPHLC